MGSFIVFVTIKTRKFKLSADFFLNYSIFDAKCEKLSTVKINKFFKNS